MIDTHCHLNLSPLYENFDAVWARAQENGVDQVIVVGTDLDTSRTAVTAAGKQEGIFASVGVHPEVENPGNLDMLEQLATAPKVVAIGECGLDYTTSSQSKNEQKRLFGFQVQLAKKLKLPLAIHCRDVKSATTAYSDLIDALEHFSKDDGVVPSFVLHCMSGTKEHLAAGLKLGGFISFAGNVTYKNAPQLRELLHSTPLDRLLVETDAPFLSPEPYRGQTNEPARVADTYRFIAGELGINLDQLDALVTANSKRLFGI